MIRQHPRRRRLGCCALALAMPAAAQDAAAADDATAPPTMDFGTWGFDPATRRPVGRSGRRLLRLRQRQVARRQPAAGRIQPLRRVQRARREVDRPTSRRWSTTWSPQNPAPGTAASGASSTPIAPISDTAAIDAAGLAPAQPYLDRIAGADDLAELAALFGEAGLSPRRRRRASRSMRRTDTLRRLRRRRRAWACPTATITSSTASATRRIRPSTGSIVAFLLGQAGYADAGRHGREGLCVRGQGRPSVEWDRATRAQPRPHLQQADPGRAAALVPAFPLATLLERGAASTDRPLRRRRSSRRPPKRSPSSGSTPRIRRQDRRRHCRR